MSTHSEDEAFKVISQVEGWARAGVFGPRFHAQVIAITTLPLPIEKQCRKLADLLAVELPFKSRAAVRMLKDAAEALEMQREIAG